MPNVYANTVSVGVTVTSPATLLAANPNRLGATIYNNTGTILYVLLGNGTVSATFFSKRMTTSDDYYQIPDGFTGVVTAIRNSGTTPQPVYVTEMTT